MECEATEGNKCKRGLPNYVMNPQQTLFISCMSQNITCSRCFIYAAVVTVMILLYMAHSSISF